MHALNERLVAIDRQPSLPSLSDAHTPRTPQFARARIFECMLVAPENIRNQLKEVVKRMLEEGFPELFPGFKDAVHAVRAYMPPVRTTARNSTAFGEPRCYCSQFCISCLRSRALTSVLSLTPFLLPSSLAWLDRGWVLSTMSG